MTWTLFEYRYRDAGNFKSHGAVALKGEVSAKQAEAATAMLQDGELFVAEQFGVPPSYAPLYRWSGGPTADDHCWHEFIAFTPVEEAALPPDLPRLGPARAFLARFASIGEWRCDLPSRPHRAEAPGGASNPVTRYTPNLLGKGNGRRKSRMGRSFENHLEAVFRAFGLAFETQVKTEHGATADFLFPGGAAYGDDAFPAARLTMLAAKSTCKDRWRQALIEARRISPKHLVTLEPAISVAQTDQMEAEHLRLVVPATTRETYQPRQRARLVSVAEFIELVRGRARAS